MRLTIKQIEQIKDLKDSGKTQTQIAKFLGVSQKSVHYWLLPQEKRKEIIKKVHNNFMQKPLEERQRIYKRYANYKKEYMKRRYHEDEVFRFNLVEKSRNRYRLYAKTKRRKQ